MNYNVKLQHFEGPLDLLLHLISINEIDIYDIPIADVTDQYIKYLDAMEIMDMENASEFIVMASTLLEIKSKMLLPNNMFDDEILKFDENDPRANLVNKLLEYKLYKNAADYLKQKEDIRIERVIKEQESIECYQSEQEELQNIDIEVLKNAVSEVIKKLKSIDNQKRIHFKSVKRDRFTVKQKIDYLISVFKNTNKPVNFKSMFKKDRSKEEVICTFLAMLEMLKLNYINIVQEGNFKEIQIYKTKTFNI